LTWLADLHKEGKIPMGSVRINKKGVDKDVRFDEWAAKMKEHFERCFWVPESPSEDH
jgi:glycogen debranching enzyme